MAAGKRHVLQLHSQIKPQTVIPRLLAGRSTLTGGRSSTLSDPVLLLASARCCNCAVKSSHKLSAHVPASNCLQDA
jgi:hypothetical protein